MEDQSILDERVGCYFFKRSVRGFSKWEISPFQMRGRAAIFQRDQSMFQRDSSCCLKEESIQVSKGFGLLFE